MTPTPCVPFLSIQVEASWAYLLLSAARLPCAFRKEREKPGLGAFSVGYDSLSPEGKRGAAEAA